MAAKPKTFDEYLAALGADQRAALEKLRKMIKAAAPGAQEYIGYGLAAFRLDGRPLVALGATGNHCGFYLMSGATVAAHKEELKSYDTSKGTIRFQADKPLPVALVFEKGRLTRITRLVASENLHSAPPAVVLQALVETLEGWDSSKPIVVEVADFGTQGLRELAFVSGARKLTVTEMSRTLPRTLQIVENLGRAEIATVTMRP